MFWTLPCFGYQLIIIIIHCLQLKFSYFISTLTNIYTFNYLPAIDSLGNGALLITIYFVLVRRCFIIKQHYLHYCSNAAKKQLINQFRYAKIGLHWISIEFCQLNHLRCFRSNG